MKILFGQQISILWGIEIHLKNGSFQIMIENLLFVGKNYFIQC